MSNKPWIVHHRDGWCALPPGAEPDPEACNDPTLCGHVVTLRGGRKRGTPTCPDCVALMSAPRKPHRKPQLDELQRSRVERAREVSVASIEELSACPGLAGEMDARIAFGATQQNLKYLLEVIDDLTGGAS